MISASVCGSFACPQISSIHDQTRSSATAGHCPSHVGYGSGSIPRRASARSTARAATFSGDTRSHTLPTSHETIPRPTQKSTQVSTVIGFSKNSRDCSFNAPIPPTSPASTSRLPITVSTGPSGRANR